MATKLDPGDVYKALDEHSLLLASPYQGQDDDFEVIHLVPGCHVKFTTTWRKFIASPDERTDCTRHRPDLMAGSPCPVVMDNGTACKKEILNGGMCNSHLIRARQGKPMGAPWPTTHDNTGIALALSKKGWKYVSHNGQKVSAICAKGHPAKTLRLHLVMKDTPHKCIDCRDEKIHEVAETLGLKVIEITSVVHILTECKNGHQKIRQLSAMEKSATNTSKKKIATCAECTNEAHLKKLDAQSGRPPKKVAKVSEEEALRRAEVRDCTPLEPYPGLGSRKWKLKHNPCGRIVSQSANNLKASGACFQCAADERARQRAIKHGEEVVAMMPELRLKPLEPYPGGTDDPWLVECLDCGDALHGRASSMVCGHRVRCSCYNDAVRQRNYKNAPGTVQAGKDAA